VIFFNQYENGVKLYCHVVDIAPFILPYSKLARRASRFVENVYTDKGVARVFPASVNAQLSLSSTSNNIAISFVADINTKDFTVKFDILRSVIGP